MNSSWVEEAQSDNLELYGDEEIFNQFDVILTRVPATHINEINVIGVIFIFKRQDSYFIEWKPNENVELSGVAEIAEESNDEWSIINQITFKPAQQSISFLSPKVKNLRIPLSDIQQFKAYENQLQLINRENHHVVTYMFKRSSPSSFLRVLSLYRLLKQSVNDRHTYIVKDPEFEKLQKSFAELNIEEIKSSKSNRPFLVHGYEFLSQIGKNVLGTNSKQNHRFQNRPGAFEFSTETSPESEGPQVSPNSSNDKVDTSPRVENEIKEKVRESHLPPRETFKRDNPLTQKQWIEFRTEDGKISDPERIREKIFKGGIEPVLRSEVWKYLLNYDIWEHTTDEREKRRKDLEEEYFRMKTQWLTLSTIQEKNFSGFRDRKCQIEKDVKRTDRNIEFYNGDENANVARLQDILLTYVMYNFDVGYVQGMSDLLSPILYLIEDEAASFWCFVGFMEKVFRNFDEDQAGMKIQLSKMRTLLEFANPRLFKYLKSHESDNMYFCFRWLLVLFKREFTHEDILELWEVLWTNLPCTNFHLLIGVAILDKEMNTFIENEYGFTEILKHVNDLSEKMNLKQVLENTESIYHQIINSKKLTDRVRIILGIDPINTYGDDPNISDSEEEAEASKKRQRTQEQNEYDDDEMNIDNECERGLEQNFF